jgi:hypothetical protein
LGGRCRRRWHYWFNHRRQCAFVVVSGITSGSFRHYDVLLSLLELLMRRMSAYDAGAVPVTRQAMMDFAGFGNCNRSSKPLPGRILRYVQ